MHKQGSSALSFTCSALLPVKGAKVLDGRAEAARCGQQDRAAVDGLRGLHLQAACASYSHCVPNGVPVWTEHAWAILSLNSNTISYSDYFLTPTTP